MSTDKILIEIFKLYGSGGEVSQKTINFVIDSIDKLEGALNDKGFGMLYEIGVLNMTILLMEILQMLL